MGNRIELGSEFNLSLNGLNTVENNLFKYLNDYGVQWYDYGRSAIRNMPIPKDKKVLLPEFICDSVLKCFREDYICYYRIDDNFNIDYEDLKCKIDDTVGCVFVVHYFGYIQNDEIMKAIREKADEYGITVVEDVTQSLFSGQELYGDYIVASVRKWMPVPMGGVLYSKGSNALPDVSGLLVSNDNSKAYGMVLKDMFLNTAYDTNSKYREIFVEAEERIDSDSEIRLLSDFSKYLIGCVDVYDLMERRKKNSLMLHNGLDKLGINSIRSFEDSECPLVYPLRVNNRDAFRKYLMENRIYCAVHWPYAGSLSENRSNAIYNSETLISLPIDQRYGEKEIDYMIDVISKYRGELQC